MSQPTQAFNAAAVMALFDAIKSVPAGMGDFARTGGSEPRSAPGGGLTFALVGVAIAPIKASGLNSTSGLVTFSARIYKGGVAANQTELDAIDPAILTATCNLFAAYSGGFTLDGTVRQIDLLGQFTPMTATPAWLEQDGKHYRVMDITIPVVVDDLWSQSA